MKDREQRVREWFQRVADNISEGLGSPFAFLTAFVLVVIWFSAFPHFKLNAIYQLTVNLGTAISTFLMVFLIQASQNKRDKAMHIKLDEIIRATENAPDEIINIEDAPISKIADVAERNSKGD